MNSTSDKATEENAVAATSSALQQLHYAALPPDKNVTTAHVHQLLGVGNHTDADVAEIAGKLAKMKQDLRSWAGVQIKSKMAEIARALGDEKFTAKVNYNKNPIASFGELKQWWMQPHVHEDALSRNSFYYIAYGYFEENPNWDVYLEETYMKKLKWEYTQESKDRIQHNSKRNGYAMKGCVARNIVMVKHELVKQLLKAGREIDDGLTLTKNRPKKTAGADSNKRRKKGEFYLSAADAASQGKQLKVDKVSAVASKKYQYVLTLTRLYHTWSFIFYTTVSTYCR
jgi:hypothetical protein